MSWYNPTEDEAAEEYYSSKSRYTDAANQRATVNRAIDDCRATKSQIKSAIRDCNNDKINFEKRIKDIHKIINALTGSGGGWTNVSIPDVVSKYNSSAQKADESFKGCVRCSDITTASIREVFKGKTVDECPDMSGALQKLQNELTRLQQALENVNRQIQQLNSQAEDLSRRMNQLSAEAESLRRTMVSSAFEMSHFKTFMY